MENLSVNVEVGLCHSIYKSNSRSSLKKISDPSKSFSSFIPVPINLLTPPISIPKILYKFVSKIPSRVSQIPIRLKFLRRSFPSSFQFFSIFVLPSATLNQGDIHSSSFQISFSLQFQLLLDLFRHSSKLQQTCPCSYTSEFVQIFIPALAIPDLSIPYFSYLSWHVYMPICMPNPSRSKTITSQHPFRNPMMIIAG